MELDRELIDGARASSTVLTGEEQAKCYGWLTHPGRQTGHAKHGGR